MLTVAIPEIFTQTGSEKFQKAYYRISEYSSQVFFSERRSQL